MAKDYSKDPNVTGWGETDAQGNAVEMGPVALQAQGFSLPPRQRPPVQQYPMGVSITQDPYYMNPANARNDSIRRMREQRSDVRS